MFSFSFISGTCVYLAAHRLFKKWVFKSSHTINFESFCFLLNMFCEHCELKGQDEVKAVLPESVLLRSVTSVGDRIIQFKNKRNLI